MGSEFDDDFEDSMQLYSTSRCFKWLWLATWNPLPVELGRSPFLCKELQTKLLFVHVPNVHSRPSQPAPTITRLQESVMLTRTIYIITNIYVYIYYILYCYTLYASHVVLILMNANHCHHIFSQVGGSMSQWNQATVATISQHQLFITTCVLYIL